jgi:hypothetical protein
MKNFSTLLIITSCVSILLAGFFITNFSDWTPPSDDLTKKQFFNRQNKSNAQKFNVFPVNIRFKNPSEDPKFNLALFYHVDGRVTYDKAHSILQGIANNLLNSSNKEISVRNLLNKYPVCLNDVTVGLWPIEGSESSSDSVVTFAKLQNGIVRYEFSCPRGITMTLWERWNGEELR